MKKIAASVLLFVSGSAIFQNSDYIKNINALKAAQPFRKDR